ncbi:MAG: hypothetical protein IJT15_04655 [Rickettsiales bacterium]|nr:hypothetical protein [Rickettsiales bacterium]
MNDDIIIQTQINKVQAEMGDFVFQLENNENNKTLDNITAQFVKDIETQNKNENRDKPKSWWQSVKSAFNRGKTEGKNGFKGFFKGCWEATKTGWQNTNKYAKMAIGAGCLLAGPLLMPLLSGASTGTSATSATLQSASQFSSLSYNFSYIGYLFAHHTDTLASSLIAPVLSLATGVGSLISGGVEVARDIINYVSPKTCFNVAQSRWNDIIAYAKYEHKQKCISQQASDINSKSFIISELNAVINAIKTEYPYFYNGNYPDGQDKDLQVVLNEYLNSLRDRYWNSQLELKHKDASLELSQNQQHINKLSPVIEKNRVNERDEENNNNITNNMSLNKSLQGIMDRKQQYKSGDRQVMRRNAKNNFKKNHKKHRDIRNLLGINNDANNDVHTGQYNSYKSENSKNDEIDSNIFRTFKKLQKKLFEK